MVAPPDYPCLRDGASLGIENGARWVRISPSGGGPISLSNGEVCWLEFLGVRRKIVLYVRKPKYYAIL
jgi:hypothetical protein